MELRRPQYELRAAGLSGGSLALEIWELPSPATPRISEPERTAALQGAALDLIEARVLRRLRDASIRLGAVPRGEMKRFHLDEDTALNLALLFRVLAPMRSLDRIRIVAEAIDQLSREEAGYWLGMAIHRRRPRRVLAALRMLLTAT
jgi:hypothetical protein